MRWVVVLIFLSLIMPATSISANSSKQNQQLNPKQSTADHSKFEELKGPFNSGPEVTKACLECHTESAKQIHKTTHWKWEYKHQKTGQSLGKKNVVNSFCGSLTSNYPRCTSCHIGYGWGQPDFDFASEEAVDCLACHDTTGTYRKFPTDAGHPLYSDRKTKGKLHQAPDLVNIAQNIGSSSRQNCGNCHFEGGGGDGVKHGDMDSSLSNPDKKLDVHMDAKGLDFSCATCHTFNNHDASGSRYEMTARDTHGIDVPGSNDGRASCESCHSDSPHGEGMGEKLNTHAAKVACQTCHIPAYARGGVATKTWWDWSTAGKMDANNKPIVKKDSKGRKIYMSKKGDFKFGENVEPEYFWFDGTVRYTLLTDKIDPEKTVSVNDIKGEYADKNSRIWPFKVMRGKQPYDKVNKTLAANHVYGKDKTSFWKNYDWDKSLKAGMKVAHETGQLNNKYSGEFGFVETEMHWPITHMVAPKENALSCDECHSREGRLDSVNGFYMPGRDKFEWLDWIGWIAAALTLIGVIIHGIMRIFLGSDQISKRCN